MYPVVDFLISCFKSQGQIFLWDGTEMIRLEF